MYKYTEKSQKCQEGVFTSFELMKKYPDMDALTALLYGQIKYWATNKEGYCWASNEKFAKLLRVSDRQIKRMLSYLIDKGLITRVMEKNYIRKLFIVEMNQPTHTDEVGGHTDLPLGHTVLPLGHTVLPPGHTVLPPGHTVLPPGHTVLHKIESKLENKLENKLESNNINYNMEIFDLVEDMEGVDNITSTKPLTGGDIIPGNDDGNDIDFLIKPEIQLSIEEKIELNKTKSSIKEEEFDIFQRNIEDAFSENELNAFSL